MCRLERSRTRGELMRSISDRPFSWRKLGLIFSPSDRMDWMRSHAAVPVPLHLQDDIFRVYFSCRDDRNRSHLGFFDFDVTEPETILNVSTAPALAPGPLGYFDDHGVYGTTMVRVENEIYCYYIGWNPSLTRPVFYPSIGLAISRDGGEIFDRHSPAPVLARSRVDPWMVSAPHVLREGHVWRMWYISGLRWEQRDGALDSYYQINYAESADGINWEPSEQPALQLGPGEKNIARACVLRHGDRYEAWYPWNRGAGYRIGFAVSEDGKTWDRKDELAGLRGSSDGWDSEAQAYPFMFIHKGTRYLLYNGNNLGRDGVGLAIGVD